MTFAGIRLGNASGDNGDTTYSVGDLVIDDTNKIVTVMGETVKMTPIEYNILKLLVKNKGRVFSIKEIYENIWKEEAVGGQYSSGAYKPYS